MYSSDLSTTTWLAESMNLTTRQAKRLIKAGQELDRFTVLGTAAAVGEVLPAQAEAITQVLADLPRDFGDDAAYRGPLEPVSAGRRRACRAARP